MHYANKFPTNVELQECVQKQCDYFVFNRPPGIRQYSLTG